MGNVMGKAYTYKKTIKRAACVMLAAGLVFTGCPKVFFEPIYIKKCMRHRGYEKPGFKIMYRQILITFDADDEKYIFNRDN